MITQIGQQEKKKTNMRVLLVAEADEDLRAFGEFSTRAKDCKDFYAFWDAFGISPAEFPSAKPELFFVSVCTNAARICSACLTQL